MRTSAPPPPAQAGPSAGTVLVDQAIFTSQRSATGEGYRVVAASPGVRPHEKMEITRRCPSHEGLCDPAPSATGLLAFPLPGGRYCVCHCRRAGWEQSGRGGERILSHAAVLSAEAFGRLQRHVLRIHSTLGQYASQVATWESLPNLPQLALPLPATGPAKALGSGPAWAASGPAGGGTGPATGDSDLTATAHLVAELLQPNPVPWIVMGTAGPWAVLDLLLSALPSARRERLAISAGLRYALSRQLDLSFVRDDQGETQRAVRGHSVRWLDWPTPPADGAAPCAAWLTMVRRWQQAGRRSELAALTDALPTGVLGPALDRLAIIAADVERFQQARQVDNTATVDLVAARYAQYSPANAAESLLLRPLWLAIGARRE